MRTLAAVLVGVMCCSGCGPAGPEKATLHPVTGKVTVGGKPLTNCGIAFTNVSTAPNAPPGFSGTLNEQGQYTLSDGADGRTGAAVGKYKVSFSVSAKAAQEAMMKGGAKPGYEAAAAPFPKEYGSSSTSPKEVEVKAGNNEINIEL